MRNLLSIVLLFLMCYCTSHSALDTAPSSERKVWPFQQLGELAKKQVSAPLSLTVHCRAGSICDTLIASLDSSGLTNTRTGSGGKALLTIEKGEDRFWENITPGYYDDWVVRRCAGRVGKEYYVDAEFVFVVTLPETGDTLLRQATVMIHESNFKDGMKPPEIPNLAELTKDVLPVIAGTTGQFAILEAQLNSSSREQKRKIIELIEKIGNPAAIAVLQKGIESEKDRRLKNKMQEVLKNLQSH